MMLKVERDLPFSRNQIVWSADDWCFEVWRIKYNTYDILDEIKNHGDLWFKSGEWVKEM
jgi:hypothetical protein